MRFDYLKPAQGPVVDGLEDEEKIFALEQPQYLPIRSLPGENGNSAIYRCELNDMQRKIIAEGGDVLIEIMHFGALLAPSRVMVFNQKNLTAEETEAMANFMRAQLQLPEKR